MHSRVTSVDADGLLVSDSEGQVQRYDAGTVLWTAGVEAPTIAKRLALATGASRDRAGRIKVNPDLTIPGHPEISVVGDLMSLRDLPGLAEVAMQSGAYAGRRIRRQLSGRPSHKAFRYIDLGSAAYIARGQAVVVRRTVAAVGAAGLAELAVHPHRLPDRLSQPVHRRDDVVGGLQPRGPP